MLKLAYENAFLGITFNLLTIRQSIFLPVLNTEFVEQQHFWEYFEFGFCKGDNP